MVLRSRVLRARLNLSIGPCLFLGGALVASGGLASTSETGGAGVDTPSAVVESDYAALFRESPFRRPLDLSESMVLTGLARVGEEMVATLRERETKKTLVVSGDADANEKGWRIVGIEGDPADLASVVATISHLGEEEFTVRFDRGQLEPPKPTWRNRLQLSPEQQDRVVEQAKNFRQGISGDGYRGPPPRELAEKLSRLSQGQREEIIARVADMRNRGAESEVRQRAIASMVERALQAGR